MTTRSYWVGAVTLAAAVAGCSSQPSGAASSSDGSDQYPCATETRALPYMPGMTEPSANGLFAVALMSSVPGPPIQGANTWTIGVNDATGSPVDGLTIGVTPWMPDDRHGTSVQAAITDQGNGAYSMAPIYLFMQGYWTVTMRLQSAAGMSDSVVFPVCIP